MTKAPTLAAIDFGISNVKVAAPNQHGYRTATLPNEAAVDASAIQHALNAIGASLDTCAKLAVTGGRHRDLPDHISHTEIFHADEIASVGLGGLKLSGLANAFVVSAGTGAAMVSARGNAVRHVSGTACGGGTLLGLSKLLLNTTDPREINALAERGDRNGVDTPIIEAIGQHIGKLPPTATAVNFGRVSRLSAPPKREDIAAGLVTLVAQTISLIAINAARAEQLAPIVMVGHLMDMSAMRAAMMAVANLYGVEFVIPPTPGLATVIGALSMIA